MTNLKRNRTDPTPAQLLELRDLTAEEIIEIRQDLQLGTAALMNAAAPGQDATDAQVVRGDDTRLTGGGASVTDGDKGDIVVSGSGANWAFDSAVVTSAGRALIDDADANAQRTTLGLGTAATRDVSASGNAGPAQVVLGNDTRLSGLADGDYGDIVISGAGSTWSIDPTVATAAGRALIDDADTAAQRTTLGLGTAATRNVPAAGNAATAEVVLGSDTRLSGSSVTIPQDFKDSVDAATTGNITLSGIQTIDGVVTPASVLVWQQTAAADNGIYVPAAGAWTRRSDADASAEITSGMEVFVEAGGAANGGLVFRLVTPDPITLGTTALTFAAVPTTSPGFIGKTVATTTYTHVLLDAQRRLNLTNAGTKTVTIAPNSSVASAVNTEIEVFNVGSGIATIVQGAGVSISAAGGVLTLEQFQCGKLTKRATPNTWDFVRTLGPHAITTHTATNWRLFHSNGSGAVVELALGAAGTVLTSAGASTAPTFSAPSLNDTVTALTISGGVVNIDCSLGNLFTLALTANVTSVTFSNLPGSGKGATKAVRMQQDGTGSRTVDLPSSFKATTGSDTAVQSAANAYTVLMITSFDNGTRWEYTMKAGAA